MAHRERKLNVGLVFRQKIPFVTHLEKLALHIFHSSRVWEHVGLSNHKNCHHKNRRVKLLIVNLCIKTVDVYSSTHLWSQALRRDGKKWDHCCQKGFSQWVGWSSAPSLCCSTDNLGLMHRSIPQTSPLAHCRFLMYNVVLRDMTIWGSNVTNLRNYPFNSYLCIITLTSVLIKMLTPL